MESAANDNATEEQAIIYPPPFPRTNVSNKAVLIRGLYSMVLYLGIGYLVLRRWDLLLVISGVLILHEAGHFLAMKFYRYTDVSMLFLPFIGAFVKGSKHEISQQQSAVIYLAGPLPGILIGIVIHFICMDHPSLYLGGVPWHLIAQILIWTNLLNLLPIFPLDGGQLLNRVFLNEEGRASNIFLLFSMVFITGTAFITGFYILLAFPLFLIYRFFSAKGHLPLENEIENSGIDINKPYPELRNEEYWKIRSIIIRHIPAFHGIAAGPPFHYHDKEDRIAVEVENILQRNLLLDITPAHKIIVVLVWALCLAVPALLGIEFLLFKYFVR